MKTLIRALGLIFLLSPVGHLIAAPTSDAKKLRVNSERIKTRILQLSEFGKNPEGGVKGESTS